MAVVNLTESERAQLMNDGSVFKSACVQKVLTYLGYVKGLGAGDLNTFLFQKKRRYASEVYKNTSLLLNDFSICQLFIFNAMIRQECKKDNAAQGELADQVIAYWSSNNSAIYNILIDDFMLEKVSGYIHE